MLREVKASQRNVRVLAFKSVTGNYTITFGKAFARAPCCFVQTATALTTAILSTIAVGSAIITTVGADQSTATDADFHLLVWGFDSADAT